MLFMFISFRISVLHLIGFLWSMLAFLLMMSRLLIAGAENAHLYGDSPIDRIFSHGGLFMRPHRARLAPKVMSHNIWCLPNAIDICVKLNSSKLINC